MTGQISPFYFKDNINNIFEHLTYVSGVAALNGECIKGFHDNGKYSLTNNSKELDYYMEKAHLLLKKLIHLWIFILVIIIITFILF